MANYSYENFSSSNSAYTGRFEIYETNNISANTTTIQWYFKLYRNDSYSSTYSRASGNRVVVYIDEALVLDTTSCGTVTAPNGAANAYTLASGSRVVSHNTDGTKSFRFSAQYTNSASNSISPLTVSNTHICSTIPRTSSFTLSASSVNIGSDITVNITRASSSFRHIVSLVTPDENTVFRTDGVETGKAVTVPWSIVQSFMQSRSLTSVTMKVYVLTYSGTNSSQNHIGTVYGTFTATVPASNFTLSTSSIDMGQPVTASIAKGSHYLNYTVDYTFEGNTDRLKSITAGSDEAVCNFTPSISAYAGKIRDKASAAGTMRVTTYCGSALAGYKELSLTLKVPSSIVPEARLSVEAPQTPYIQNKSRLPCHVTASASYSTITKIEVFRKGADSPQISQTYSTANVTDAILSAPACPAAGISEYYIRVSDARGRSVNSSVQNVDIAPYSPPTVKIIRCERNPENPQEILLDFEAKAAAAEGITHTIECKYRFASEEIAESYPLSITGEDQTKASGYVTTTKNCRLIGFNPDKSYNIQLMITDTVLGASTSASDFKVVPTIECVLDIYTGGKGIAFGKTAEQEGRFEVEWNAYFSKPVTINPNATCGLFLSNANGVESSVSYQTKDNAWTVGVGCGNNASQFVFWDTKSNAARMLLDSSGYLRVPGEIQSATANSFRLVNGNYGAFWSNDGSSYYLRLTNSGDPYGDFNSLQPLTVNLSTGVCVTNGNLPLTGGTLTGNITFNNYSNSIIFPLTTGKIHLTTQSSGASFHIAYVANGSSGWTSTPLSINNSGTCTVNGCLSLTGGTMSGHLTLPNNIRLNIGSGHISTNGNQKLYFAASGETTYELFYGVRDGLWTFAPSDANLNNMTLGSPNYKWTQLWAGTSTIGTSDRNEKNSISILDAEQWKCFLMGLKPVSYKFNNGSSNRLHHGMIAQDVEQLLESLDIRSQDFAGFVKYEKMKTIETVKEIEKEDGSREKYTEREEAPVLDEYGNPVYGYGLRYEEFIAPIISALQSSIREIEDLKLAVEVLKQNNNCF